MGKSKFEKRCRKLEKKHDKFVSNLADIADDVYGGALHILENWVPTKQGGLSKKESRAAYVGFALGMINATSSIITNTRLRDNDGSPSLYEWLCDIVTQYRDDRETFDEQLGKRIAAYLGENEEPDEDDLNALFEFFEKLITEED